MAAAAAMRGDLPAGYAAGEDGVHQGLRIPSFHRAAERVVHTRVLGPGSARAFADLGGVPCSGPALASAGDGAAGRFVSFL